MITTNELVIVKKDDFTSDAELHENVINRFKETDRLRRNHHLGLALFLVVLSAIAGIVLHLFFGFSLYGSIAASVFSLALLLFMWKGLPLLAGWYIWVFMSGSEAKALMIVLHNETNIAKYYSEFLWADSVNKHLTGANGENVQMTDLRIDTDMTDRFKTPVIIKKDVLVAGDFDFGDHIKTITVTLSFNKDNSQLTASQYQISTAKKEYGAQDLILNTPTQTVQGSL